MVAPGANEQNTANSPEPMKETTHCSWEIHKSPLGSAVTKSKTGVSSSSGKVTTGTDRTDTWALRMRQSKTSAMEMGLVASHGHRLGSNNCGRKSSRALIHCDTRSTNLGSSNIQSLQGQTSCDLATSHDRKACSCVSGGNMHFPWVKTSIRATTKLKIQAACNGEAIWPMAERAKRTFSPKSIIGSTPLRS